MGDSGLADAAQTAFVNGMHVAALAAAGVALAGAVIAYLVIPAREREEPATGRAAARGARPRMSETAESPRRMPGRPRSEASHQAIIEATLELLIEGGYGALTMEAVRTRAGVGKATIYRRWSSKEELVRDAIVFLHDEFDDARHRQPARRLRRARHGAVRASASRGGAATLMPRLLGESVQRPRAVRDLPRPPRRAPRARRCARCSSARSRAARSARDSTSS